MSQNPTTVLSLSLPGAEVLDPQSSPPIQVFLSNRPSPGSGVYLGNFVSHDEPAFSVNGERAHKWTFIADPSTCNIPTLRAEIQALVREILAFHVSVGRDPAKWSPRVKSRILAYLGELVKTHNLQAARQQQPYFARGATAPARDRSSPTSVRSDLTDLFMLEDADLA